MPLIMISMEYTHNPPRHSLSGRISLTPFIGPVQFDWHFQTRHYLRFLPLQIGDRIYDMI